MAESEVHRKLTAILCADVVGYSRLMGDDEEATIETLTAYRKVFTSEIKKHRGRVVDAKGDAILAEFASVVDAVKGAVEIQRELAENNSGLPDDRRMEFRIGINIGDVVVKDDIIYGDGVNIAARLEALAEAGGVCISRPVYDQVKSKLKLDYEYMGEQQVKNIAEPVRAYKVVPESPKAGREGEAPQVKVSERSVFLELPEKPSIAVLPFNNLSADPGQEFFADGLVEEVLTSLSKISSMIVIARNSSFAYRSKAVDVRQIAQELGARYVVEGSVRQGGDRLRITAQLIDSTDGSHIWAERYDRVVEDVFDIQDEITKEIVTALQVNLDDGEKALFMSRGTKNVQAWGFCMQALEFHHNFNPVDQARARELAEKSLQLDPEYSAACAVLGITHWFDSLAGFSSDRVEALSRAKGLAEKAISLDGANPLALNLTVFVQVSLRKFDEAIAFAEKAVELNPASVTMRISIAYALLHGGYPEEAISILEGAMRLNPWHPAAWKNILARALDAAGRTAEATEILDAILGGNPKHFGALLLHAAILSREGRMAEAATAIGNFKGTHANFRLAHVPDYLIMRNQEYVDALTENLRKAGLPD